MSDAQASDYERYLYEKQQRHAERAHDTEKEFFYAVNEACIRSGESAVKFCMLINGGAALAMLSFLGALASQGKITTIQLTNLSGTLMWFAMGVAAGALSQGFAYLTNFSLAGMSSRRSRVWDFPYLLETRASAFWSKAYYVFITVAVVMAIAAFVLFIIGICDVRSSLKVLAT
jgi:hypothetical protein